MSTSTFFEVAYIFVGVPEVLRRVLAVGVRVLAGQQRVRVEAGGRPNAQARRRRRRASALHRQRLQVRARWPPQRVQPRVPLARRRHCGRRHVLHTHTHIYTYIILNSSLSAAHAHSTDEPRHVQHTHVNLITTRTHTHIHIPSTEEPANTTTSFRERKSKRFFAITSWYKYRFVWILSARRVGGYRFTHKEIIVLLSTKIKCKSK